MRSRDAVARSRRALTVLKPIDSPSRPFFPAARTIRAPAAHCGRGGPSHAGRARLPHVDPGAHGLCRIMLEQHAHVAPQPASSARPRRPPASPCRPTGRARRTGWHSPRTPPSQSRRKRPPQPALFPAGLHDVVTPIFDLTVLPPAGTSPCPGLPRASSARARQRDARVKPGRGDSWHGDAARAPYPSAPHTPPPARFSSSVRNSPPPPAPTAPRVRPTAPRPGRGHGQPKPPAAQEARHRLGHAARQRQHGQAPEGAVGLLIVGECVVARNAQQHRRHAEGQRDLARRAVLGLDEIHVLRRSPSPSSRARLPAASAGRHWREPW